MPAAGAQGQVTTQQVEDVFSKTLGRAPESVVQVGNGDSATIQIRTETLSNPDNEKLRTALFDAFQPKAADGQPSKDEVSSSDVSETWGGQITKKALIALVVFLVARRRLHRGALRAVHGGRGAGGAGVRPRRSRPGSTRWSASRSPRPR